VCVRVHRYTVSKQSGKEGNWVRPWAGEPADITAFDVVAGPHHCSSFQLNLSRFDPQPSRAVTSSQLELGDLAKLSRNFRSK
jgi:hypothetical protein